MSRIIIDITTLARWRGPPAGISRCQSRYAGFASRNFPQTVFTIYDPRLRQFRMLSEKWARAVLNGLAKIDMSMMPDPTGLRRRSIEKIPEPLWETFWWITKLRRKLVSKLEQWRLKSASPDLRSLLERVQSLLIARKNRDLFYRTDGSRVDWPEIDAIAGPPLVLEAGDTTIAIQYDWLDTNIGVLARMREEAGSRHIVLCHDIIPMQSPEWYSASDVSIFRAYYDRAFKIADRVIFTSRRTAADATDYCRSVGIEIADHRVVAMGSDSLAPPAPDVSLPLGLSEGKYVLFVSTIEPRKNHQLLIDAWRRLVGDGTIDATGFKLVLVGRKGWMMGSFFDDLRADSGLASSVLHLSGIDDAVLSKLYRDAAFCVYPPKFEGFGLPPVEALAAGQALIVSNAGPIPEVVGDFALCLDPNDLDLWTARLREWIGGSPERENYAARAKAGYKPVTWDDSAKSFFEAALSRP